MSAAISTCPLMPLHGELHDAPAFERCSFTLSSYKLCIPAEDALERA